MTILKLKNIHKSYKIGKDYTKVLQGIELDFKRGEFVSILGESGCGKSTLMNIIGGLDSDFEGDIIVAGKSIKKFSPRELDDYRKDKIGFIFQSFNLIPHLSVLENVELAMTMSDKKASERRERAKELIEELGLLSHLYKKPNQLSGGQKQRVAIARALANDPDIILADEPTGSLDSKTAEQILGILQTIADKGKLIIAVTHSNKVANFSTRIVKMADGTIVGDEEIKKTKDFSEDQKSVRLKPLKFIEAIKLALNNIRLNIGRNILVSLGTSIGIFSMVLMLSLGSGVEKFITNEINSSLNPLTIEVTKQSSSKPREIINENKGFNQSDIDFIKKIKGVDSLSYDISYMLQVATVYENKPYTLTIFETVGSNIKDSDLTYGTLPKNGIIISKKLADNFDENNKSLLNKDVLVQIPVQKSDGTMMYISKTLPIDGIYDGSNVGYGDNMGVFISYDLLSSIYSENKIDIKPTTVNIHVKSENVVSGIKSTLSKNGYEGSRQEAILKQVNQYLSIAVTILTAIAGISLLVSAIMILVVLYISVVERTREIGILRSIGARKKDIRRIFFVESAILGAMGGVFGIAIAFIISLIGNRILTHLYGSPFINITLTYVLFGIIISTFVSIVAGLMPSSKAAKLDPVESLRHE